MKVLKGIGLFFVYPTAMLLLGFWGGIHAANFFYPGGISETLPGENSGENRAGSFSELEEQMHAKGQETSEDVTRQASTQRDTLSADTEYVLLETDILRGTEVETSWRLPHKYIGLDREKFVTMIENYSNFPPLSEKERGFINAEVVSFARERVVVRMNYQYVQPGAGFYLAVKDNEVVVYLEDQTTVYINTGILLETLPEELQMEIMEMLFVEDEGTLYSLLETYSS